ncbi:MAG: DEAD/DEAH box helicase [Clostridiales bacterium]|nr:DEAD/DEAH box helicase [Clostridiales bacterium]
MNLDQLLNSLRQNRSFMDCVTHWRTLPASDGSYADFPVSMDERIQKVLQKKGIFRLYTHQAESFRLAEEKKDFVVVTPTASGKTLCYNLPVLSAILKNPDARALYLFPTKALSADQVSGLYQMITDLDMDIKAYTYDGDTQAVARKAIRQAGHIVVTNPDMLHANMLPHHTKWVKLFENLEYIVIDEIHTYRGVFGSHLANVLRRLMRLCAFYGSHPRFILCSATIQNPVELAQSLTGRTITPITENGAPMGERHFIFYNPPVVNKQLGIRKGVVNEALSLAQTLMSNQIPTILFAKSRVQVEVLTRRLKDSVKDAYGFSPRVRGYRGGYLPSERREIEKGLRAGEVDMVVSTNALELGIDIGSLNACILCGYPGTIASTWQQAGRAGRRKDTAVTFLVASSAALDQYIIEHPDYFFGASPENALVAPNNLYILLSHLKCSAYELPFQDGETFGGMADTAECLEYLTENNILRHLNGKYYWMEEDLPSGEISLRSATSENFVIIDITNPAHHRVIGEMDRFTVPMLLHENAIYMHEARQYQVEKLDFDACKAFIRAVDVDYYTDADMNVSLHILDDLETRQTKSGVGVTLGELRVSTIVKIFKKMKLDTHENLGFGQVMLPQTDMHTVGMWWTIPDSLAARYSNDELQGALVGVANLLGIVAPLYLMCSPRDIRVVYQVKAPITDKPTIFLYDSFPGGVGLSEKAFSMQELLLEQALQVLAQCGCGEGCPSCVGPVVEVGAGGKAAAEAVLKELLGQWQDF